MAGLQTMEGTSGSGLAEHFGKQLRRDRLAHGWSIAELARRMDGVNGAHLGRVENGKRPPTFRLAARCDAAFPERKGWYSAFLEDVRKSPEIPATFRSWSDYEERSATLRVWMPGIVDGLVQTPWLRGGHDRHVSRGYPQRQQTAGWPAGWNASGASWAVRKHPGSRS